MTFNLLNYFIYFHNLNQSIIWEHVHLIYYKLHILTIPFIYKYPSENVFFQNRYFSPESYFCLVNVTQSKGERNPNQQVGAESFCVLLKIMVYSWLSFPVDAATYRLLKPH